MRRTILAALVLAAASAAPHAHAAGKITIDPNATPKTTPGAPVRQVDARLDRKVTYEGGYKRLHNVAEDLSKSTGVTIRCGKSIGDWEVRDIPVVVCVKDMALVKLLKVIAESTHVILSVDAQDTSQKGRPPVYRLSRDRKAGKAIAGALQSRDEAMRELSRWAWDALAGLCKDGEKPKGVNPDAALVGRVLSALGPETREKVLGGERLTVKAKAVLPTALLEELVTRGSALAADRSGGYIRGVVPTEAEMGHVTLTVKCLKTDPSQSDEALCLYLWGLPKERMIFHSQNEEGGFFAYPAGQRTPPANAEYERDSNSVFDYSPIRLARELALVKSVKLPAAPNTSAALKGKGRVPGPDMKPLTDEKDWKLPLLQAKVRVRLPKDKGLLNQSDVLLALAESGNLSIVCEDFVSHKCTHRFRAGMDLGEGATVQAVLHKLGESRVETEQTDWFVNEEQRLLVGWANGWEEHHTNLAPESIVTDIHSKCWGEQGAELDDVVPVFRLTVGQHMEWILEGRDLPHIVPNMLPIEQSIWQAYDALNRDQKESAKSEVGFPLASLDPSWLPDMMCRIEKDAEDHVLMAAMDEDLPAEARHRKEMLSDLGFLSTATMKVRGEPVKSWPAMSLDADGMSYTIVSAEPDAAVKHCYTIELSGKRNGEDARVTSKWELMAFPYYAPEKETELRAQSRNGK
jgi:hypothetical protein